MWIKFINSDFVCEREISFCKNGKLGKFSLVKNYCKLFLFVIWMVSFLWWRKYYFLFEDMLFFIIYFLVLIVLLKVSIILFFVIFWDNK